MRYLGLSPAFSCPPPWRAWEALAGLEGPHILWRDRAGGSVWLGVGVGGRFASLASCRAALQAQAAPIPLRGFLARPFAPDAAASVVVPALLLRWEDGQAQLAVAASRANDAARLQAMLTNPPPLRPPLMVDGGHRFTRAAWIAAVDAARAEIRAGHLQKLVLARDSYRDSLRPVPVSSVLECLSATTPGCYLFAVTTADGGTFLGASPEQLFRLEGEELTTESLAGTRQRGDTPDEDAALATDLLHSRKDTREQMIVTDFLAAALSALCASHDIASAPVIRPLASVQHLVTPGRGRLRPGVTPDDVLAALHPTPAVCGLPRAAALAAMARLEPAPRGLYAGAIGFIDTQTAEFAVAIRSALVTATRATVYGGAGIVEASDPLEEWNETSWKMRPLLAALGCAPR